MDDDLKDELNVVLDGLGLNMSTLMTIVAKRVVAEKGLPFELKLAEPAPELSESVQRAIVESRAMDMGIIPDTRKSYSSVDDMMDDILGEADDEV
jgi:addiction module RelB/DinJ family antitoxin